MVLRKPDPFINPQFWAEDSSVFFLGADQQGITTLFEPYAGYLHLIPRVIALCGTPFAPEFSPAFFNYGALACMLIVSARVFSPRLTLPGKPWLAMSLVFVPHTGEVFANVTNIQWITAFLLIQMSLMSDGLTWREHAVDVCLAVAAGLSGPFSIIMAPFFLARCWVHRSAASYGLTGVVAMCASVQLWFLLHSSIPNDSTPLSYLQLFGMLGRRVVLLLLLGPDHQGFLGVGATALTAGFMLGGLLGLGFMRTEYRREKTMLWLCFCGMLIAAALRCRPDRWSFDDFVNGDRYFYIPKVLLLWLLVFEFAGIWHRIFARYLAIWIITANASSFGIPGYQDYHWRDYCEMIRNGDRVIIPMNPVGWKMTYPGHAHR